MILAYAEILPLTDPMDQVMSMQYTVDFPVCKCNRNIQNLEISIRIIWLIPCIERVYIEGRLVLQVILA
jgi:hypothetical protein